MESPSVMPITPATLVSSMSLTTIPELPAGPEMRLTDELPKKFVGVATCRIADCGAVNKKTDLLTATKDGTLEVCFTVAIVGLATGVRSYIYWPVLMHPLFLSQASPVYPQLCLNLRHEYPPAVN